MDPYAALPLPQSAFVLALSLVLVSPLALAGVALMNAGLGRSRSAAQSMLGTLALIAVSVIVFALIGAMFAYGDTGYTFTVGGRPWNWIGAGSFALRGFSA